MSTWDLIDVWRERNPYTGDYSFFSHRHISYSRIDMVLLSWGISFNMINPDIGLSHLSGHVQVMLTWRLEHKRQEGLELEIKQLFY